MRAAFTEYFPMPESTLEQLWKDGLIALDANVLLHFYRSSPSTRNQLEATLKALKERLFVPHQAVKEFFANRVHVTGDYAAKYKGVIDRVNKLFSDLSGNERPSIAKEHLEGLRNFNSVFIEQLKAEQKSMTDLQTSDDTLNALESLLAGRVGQPFDAMRMDEIAEEGQRRYASGVPPGHEDKNKDTSRDPYKPYGDLILWEQLIAYASEVNKPMIFVTDDSKGDWWLESKSQPTQGPSPSPRPELRAEFMKRAGQSFWMYKVAGFVKAAEKITHQKVSDDALEEMTSLQNDVNVEAGTLTVDDREFLDLIDQREERVRRSHGDTPVLANYFVQEWAAAKGVSIDAAEQMLLRLEHRGLVRTPVQGVGGWANPQRCLYRVK